MNNVYDYYLCMYTTNEQTEQNDDKLCQEKPL